MTFLQVFILTAKIYFIFTFFRFFYLFILSRLYSIKCELTIDTERDSHRYSPLVSVLIPAWNEEVGIRKTIVSVLGNTYKNVEVIVVNDGSTDRTSEIVSSLISENKEKRITLINQENARKAAALNNGIKKCKGDLVLVIDADSYLYKDAIEKMVQPFSNNNVDFTIGDIRIGNIDSLIGLIQYYEYAYGFDVYKKSQSITNSIYIMSGAFTLFKRSLAEKVGYWSNYTVVEDVDFSLKMRGLGTNGVYVADAVEITEGPSSIKQLINQRIRWKRSFLDSLFVNRHIILNKNVNKYLSFIELPLLLISIVENYVYPLMFIANMYLLITAQEKVIPIIYFVTYTLLYMIVLLPKVIELRSIRSFLYLPFIPFIFQIIAIIEYYALLVTTVKILLNQKGTWDKLQRVGLN